MLLGWLAFLQDVLENEQVKLDNMFKFSLMQDIVRVCPSSSAYLFLCALRGIAKVSRSSVYMPVRPSVRDADVP